MDTDLRTDAHYVNAADGEHYPAKIDNLHKNDGREVADLDVDVPIGDGKRYNVLRDEANKAGNTWHYVESE